MTVTPTKLADQRRYSSLLIVHPRLRTIDALAQCLGSNLVLHRAVGVTTDHWDARVAEYLAPTNFYPGSAGDAELRKQPDGYPHHVYVAQGFVRDVKADAILLASPYVRLLQRIVKELTRKVREPAIQYVTLDMPTIYKAFERGQPSISATKVTLQMLSQPGLELVSLTGRNPLDSELHEQIKSVAAPYALRAEVMVGTERARVNLDRHGNLWWYQTDESKFQMALTLMDAVSDMGAMRLSRTVPLDRAEPDDESP